MLPASVRLSLRVERFSSFTDSERSSALTCLLARDFEMPSLSAAAEKLFASTTCANTLMPASLSFISFLFATISCTKHYLSQWRNPLHCRCRWESESGTKPGDQSGGASWNNPGKIRYAASIGSVPNQGDDHDR